MSFLHYFDAAISNHLSIANSMSPNGWSFKRGLTVFCSQEKPAFLERASSLLADIQEKRQSYRTTPEVTHNANMPMQYAAILNGCKNGNY